MSGRIIAGMATIPERAAFVRRTVDSIIDQVDALHIGFNGFAAVPEWVDGPPWYRNKIVPHLTCNETLGDAAKFCGLTDDYDYYLSIDDDLVYPPGYAHYMKEWCRTLSHGVVSLHGRRFDKLPIRSYYKDATAGGSCLRPQIQVVPMHCPGSGVMCVHKSLGLRLDEFKAPNMADVWAGVAARRRGVGVFLLPHPGGYLTYADDLPIEETLWYSERMRDERQTEAINEHFAYEPETLRPTA